MASEPLLAVYPLATIQRSHSAWSSVVLDYWTLTKPEINFLIGLATAAAFCAGCSQPLSHFPWGLLLHTLLGTVMVASGAATLNQLIERQFDAQMRRTARRPVAAGESNQSMRLFLVRCYRLEEVFIWLSPCDQLRAWLPR